MRYTLHQHPDSQCLAVTGIEVEINRLNTTQLMLIYNVTGIISDLRLSPLKAPVRSNELWLHTCFEAFVRNPGQTAYTEFNFAPSTAWAAWSFDDYREGMREACDVGTPKIQTQAGASHYQLHATLSLADVPSLPHDGLWQLGVSAIIEEANGRQSYWSLAHPPGAADFHHPDNFTLYAPI